ncbi:MAG: hypothetical protein HDS15_00985 [Bacteroides sp.]|nr:hypothetical protein [Bacteroides sp.]
MAKIKSSLSFLDRLDKAIFGRFNPDHVPATGSAILVAFIASMVLSITIFGCQIFGVSGQATNVIAAIGLVAIVAWVVYVCLPAAKSFNGWGLAVAYLAYSIVLTALAFYLALWTTVLAILVLVVYGVAKAFFSSPKSSGSKKFKIRYSDGTEEEAVEEIGLLGEKTYTGNRTQNRFDEYEINNLKS